MSARGVDGKTVRVVGFGPRAAALVIDAMLVWFLGILLGTAVAVAGLLLTMFTADWPPPLDWLVILSGLVFSVVYFTVAWSKSGQTLGKTVVGIKVVGKDGRPPSGGKALLRYLGYILSGLVLSLGFLWAALDRKRQGWHDKIAGTYVISEDEDFSDVSKVNLVPSDRGPAWVWVALWVLLVLTMPTALLSTILTLGPYVTKALVSLLARG